MNNKKVEHKRRMIKKDLYEKLKKHIIDCGVFSEEEVSVILEVLIK